MHEQTRPDRDEYIKIFWANVIQGSESQFVKYNKKQYQHFGAPYDTCSLMHYESWAFTKGPTSSGFRVNVSFCFYLQPSEQADHICS